MSGGEFQMSGESATVLPDITVSTKRIRPSRRKDKNPNILPAKCQICSNAAVGYHYDVPSCNGCKAFFRRTIITGKKHKCIGNNRCLERIRWKDTSRKLCGGCRFAKCEELGMNPMAIQEELISKEGKSMQKEILQRRSSEPLRTPFLCYEDEMEEVIQQLSVAETHLENLYNFDLESQESCSNWDWRPLSDIIQSSESFEINHVPHNSFAYSQTSFAETSFAHYSFLSIVEHVKLLNFFSNLDPESTRRIITRGALICRNMTLSHYSTSHNKWKSNKKIWTENIKSIEKLVEVFARNSLDCKEYMLLKVIVLCDPAVPELPLEDQMLIEQERQRYAQILLAYCLKHHGMLDGPSRYASLLSMISIMEMQQWEQKCCHVLTKAFYRESGSVSPLYEEIMGSSF